MKQSIKLSLLASVVVLVTGCSNVGSVQNKWCYPEEPKETTERINIAADALFYFDKSDTKDLLPEGRRTLDNLANQISNDYISVSSIALVGHTDRLGTAEYNQALGQRRADTVKRYLQAGGVTAPISTASAGKTQPVTTHCVGTKSTPELRACLQPDRRVTVDIKGLKKVNK